MRTINDLQVFLLNTSSRHAKHIDVLGRQILLRCSSLSFLEHLEKTYEPTTLIKRQHPPFGGDVCVIDSTTHCRKWSAMLPDQPIRTLKDPYVGHCEIYKVHDGLVLQQNNGWVVFRSMEGQLIFLLDGPLETDIPGQFPNLTGLISLFFSEILASSDKWLVHAAGIGKNGCCHLFTGRSGSGKTTRSLAHVTKGYSFFGDDMVVLGKGNNDRWEVWPFWRPLHITRHTCKLLPALPITDLPTRASDKKSLDVKNIVSATPPLNTRLESIWFLTANDSATPPRRLDHQDAFTLLSQTFMHGFWPETTKANLEALLDIVTQIPVFSMTRSTPLAQMVDELYIDIISTN
jgi:hypothetical protein